MTHLQYSFINCGIEINEFRKLGKMRTISLCNIINNLVFVEYIGRNARPGNIRMIIQKI